MKNVSHCSKSGLTALKIPGWAWQSTRRYGKNVKLKTVVLEERKRLFNYFSVYETSKLTYFCGRRVQNSVLNVDRCLLNLSV